MKDWLDAKAIAGIVMFMAQLLGFSLPTLKQSNLNGAANIIARDAWNACEEEKDEIVIQRDALWERLLQQRAERSAMGLDISESFTVDGIPESATYLLEAESGPDQ